MDKIRVIDKYINTVKENSSFFKRYYFHSLIDLNLVKLDSILKHGIFSKQLLQQKELITIYTHNSKDYDSKNGENYISLTEYTDNCEFCSMFESFPLHTLTSISILIDKTIQTTHDGERETYFDDELFCLNSIPKSKFKGIILPEHLSLLPINKVNCLPNDISCYTRVYLNHWLECIETYFKEKIDAEKIEEVKVSFHQLWTILNEFESPEKFTQLAIKIQREKYGKDLKDVLANILHNLWSNKIKMTNPNYMDVLMTINDDNFPIYEIKEKTLKKIN